MHKLELYQKKGLSLKVLNERLSFLYESGAAENRTQVTHIFFIFPGHFLFALRFRACLIFPEKNFFRSHLGTPGRNGHTFWHTF